MERFNALEGLRGIFSLFVMLAHFNANFHGKAWVSDLTLYYFIDFFFIFSGFLMARIYWSIIDNREDFNEYMLVRVARVYPLHLFWLAVFVVFEVFRMTLPSGWLDTPPFTGVFSLDKLAGHLFLSQSMLLSAENSWNFPSWSLSTELYAYVVFGLLLLLFRKARVLATVLLIGLSLAILFWISPKGFQETICFGFFRCLAGFMLGVLIFKVYERTQHLRQQPRLMTVLESIALFFFVTYSTISNDKTLSFLAPLVSGYMVWVLTYDAGWVSRFFATRPALYLGSISFSLYLAHVFIQDRMMNLFKLLELEKVGTFFVPDRANLASYSDTLLGTSPWEGDVYAILMILTTIVVSHFTFHHVEERGRLWSKEAVKRRRAKRRALLSAAQ